MGARSDDAGDAFERVAVRRVAGCAPGASREEANSFEGNTVSNADQKTSDVGLNIDGFARATHHRSDSHEHSEAPSSGLLRFFAASRSLRGTPRAPAAERRASLSTIVSMART